LALEAEEDPAVPLGPSDLIGNRGQRLKRPAEIFEVVLANRYAVLDALPFSDQLGAGDGWIILGDMSVNQRSYLTKLERQGKLSDEKLSDVVYEARLRALR